MCMILLKERDEKMSENKPEHRTILEIILGNSIERRIALKKWIIKPKIRADSKKQEVVASREDSNPDIQESVEN